VQGLDGLEVVVESLLQMRVRGAGGSEMWGGVGLRLTQLPDFSPSPKIPITAAWVEV